MNTRIKHTPGPWSIGSADNYTRRTIVGPREGMSHKLIARMPGEYRENHAIFPEMLANAALIAAAPALYEALQWARQYLRMPNFHPDNSYNSEQWARDYNKLTDAIAQAERGTL